MEKTKNEEKIKVKKRLAELSKNSAPILFDTPLEDAVKNIEENKRRLNGRCR